jgi:predicted ATPase/class 3 adenylate cyclase
MTSTRAAQRTHSAPAGTVTFLFTDIEGSTRLWERDGARMSQALAAHDALARRAVESRRGTVVKMTGDGLYAIFDDALDALAAALELQRALVDTNATNGVELRVRCALHAGAVERRDDDYFGSPVNRAARIMSAAHGGQVLLSQAVVDRVRHTLPPPVSLRDLGNVRLKDLATPEHVYQLVDPRLRLDFPPLRSLEGTPNNLPQQPTSFIGRDSELGDLAALLAKSRILTLTGAGGCGKTRLALQLAADALEQFSDGVWMIELAALSSAGFVAQTVAKTLGLKEEADRAPSETVADYLADKCSLLMLDNCEHLLDACASLADAIVRRCANVKILATSREALGIGGEQAYRVPSLSLPDPNEPQTPESVAQCESVRLFVDRAALVRAGFGVTAENAATLASICSRLDGIPLAIELAAARARSLSVEEIESKLNQRFRLLTGGSRTALPRQQTLRSLIDWSYDLLGDSAKLLLQRLSVFAGGWLLEAAESICAGATLAPSEILDLLTSLSDKSLVAADPNDANSRFRMVETVRQYAKERLLESGGGDIVRDRHLDYYLALAEKAEPELVGARQVDWLRILAHEHDNLRSALEWSLGQAQSSMGLRLCGALQRFWMTRGHVSEGREWCSRVLSAPGSSPRSATRAKTLNGAGLLAYHQLDYAAARAYHEDALAIRRELGDRKGEAASLNNIGIVALDQGDTASARAMHEQSLQIAREIGNRNGMARSLGNLSMVAMEQRDFAAARPLAEECLAILRELADRGGIAIGLHTLAGIAFNQSDLASAGTLLRESLTMLRELGDKGRIAYSLDEIASVVAAVGAPARAARIWGAAQRLREALGAPAANNDALRMRIDAARAALHDDSAFYAAWQQGRALTLDQALDLVLGDADDAN